MTGITSSYFACIISIKRNTRRCKANDCKLSPLWYLGESLCVRCLQDEFISSEVLRYVYGITMVTKIQTLNGSTRQFIDAAIGKVLIILSIHFIFIILLYHMMICFGIAHAILLLASNKP